MVEEKFSMEDVVKHMESCQHIFMGKVVEGEVIEVDKKNGYALIDIGLKSEGIITLDEFDGKEIKIGDKYEVCIVKKNSDDQPPILSHKKAKAEHKWDDLDKAHKDELVIDIKIGKRIKGGLIVDIDGIKGFMPASLAGYPMVKNLDAVMDKIVPCKIIEFDRAGRNVVVSWRKAIEEDVKRKREVLFEQLYPGKSIKGKVTGIKTFGAFIDLGSVDGLLHISELSWGHVNKVEDIVKIGDEIKVKIKSFNPNSNKISLSLKDTLPHPWENISEKYEVGNIVDGKVTGVTSYGGFIELEPGIEGLLRSEELSWTKEVKHAGHFLKVADKIKVKILELDKEKERISLSLRKVSPNPWDEVSKNYQKGNIIEGKITHIADFGAFMMLKEGVEGLIHISDMSWDKEVKSSDLFKVGDTLKVKILNIEADKQKISLGLKQIENNPYSDYPKGSEVEGEVIIVELNGAYLKLQNSLQAYLHISNYSKKRVDNLQDHLKEGDVLKCKVIKNNPSKKYIELSVKSYNADKEKADIEKYSKSSEPTGATLYDLIGDKLDGLTEE